MNPKRRERERKKKFKMHNWKWFYENVLMYIWACVSCVWLLLQTIKIYTTQDVSGLSLAALIQLRFMMDAIYGDIVKLDNGTYVAESMLIRQDMMAEAKRSKEETTEEARRLKVDEEKKDEENQ